MCSPRFSRKDWIPNELACFNLYRALQIWNVVPDPDNSDCTWGQTLVCRPRKGKESMEIREHPARTSVAFLLSLIAPALWLLIALVNSDRFELGIFGPLYLWYWTINPTFLLWLGSVPLATGMWLLWKRVAGWSLLTVVPCLVVYLLLVSVLLFFFLPTEGGMFFGSSGGDLRTASLVTAMIMAFLSFPVWIHIGLHRLARRPG